MKIQAQGQDLVIVDFNEADAYRIASKIEADGVRFYQKLIDCVSGKTVKSKLQILIDEEKRHLKFFQQSLAKLEEEREGDFEEDNLLNYMDYKIFQPYQDMKEMCEIIDDAEKAIDLGIVVEDKSLKFYEKCLRAVSEEKTKKELQKIIDEEKGHRAFLEHTLEEFQKGK